MNKMTAQERFDATPPVGYCPGVKDTGLMCFVRNHCMRYTHPTLTEQTVDTPFCWWLADHATWAMECSEYVEDPIAVARFIGETFR